MLEDRRTPRAREWTAWQALVAIAVTSAGAVLLGWLCGVRSPVALCIGLVVGCGLAGSAVRGRDVGLMMLTGPAAGFSAVAIPLLTFAPSVLSRHRSQIDQIFQTYNYGVPAMIAGAFVALLVAAWRDRRS